MVEMRVATTRADTLRDDLAVSRDWYTSYTLSMYWMPLKSFTQLNHTWVITHTHPSTRTNNVVRNVSLGMEQEMSLISRNTSRCVPDGVSGELTVANTIYCPNDSVQELRYNLELTAHERTHTHTRR